jgi:hypothetical protein
MFCTPQFLISIPFLIMLCQRYFDRFASSANVKTLFLFLLIFLSFFSNPDAIRNYQHRISMVRNNMLKLSQPQQVLQSFLPELFRIEKEFDKKRLCVYIPQTEKWYYSSQSYKPLGQLTDEPDNLLASPMVVPAITGIALIGGISDSIYKSNYNYSGYYYYKKTRQFQVKSIAEAKYSAIKKGYTRLIEYQCVDGKLVEQVFDLKK